MMEPVESVIRSELSREEVVFVFPSEVAARAWQRRALRLTQRRAVRDRRFLSWDRFKEETFSLVRSERPVNRLARTLFAASLLEENARAAPLLRSVVHPRHARSSSAFVKTLTSILPQLGAAREIVGDAERLGRRLDPERSADLALLWERYGAFLARHGLFEPAYERIDISRLERTYVLFFPEVIEDYEAFRPQLDSPRIRTVSLPAPDAPRIRQFDNAVQELRWLFVSLTELLDGGVAPGEIAITVPQLDRWRTHLESEAKLRGVPLDFRQGQPLARYPQGRLFRSIERTVRDGFSLSALKSLLLDRAFPWKHGERARRLVRFGIDRHCAGTIRNGSRDLWRENLHRADERELLSFYSSLRSELEAIVSAPSFDELKARLFKLIHARLDTERWSFAETRVFEFCLQSLDEFIDVERSIPELTPRSPFGLWLAHLDERIYVVRSEIEGIPVFPYRVSAGIAPVHHFVVGANQRATAVERPLLAFLTAEERHRLGIEDRPFTDAFFALYLQSGDAVHASYSREDFDGPALPPGRFVASNGVIPFEQADELRERDPFAREPALWRGDAAPPERLFPVQKSSLAAARGIAWTPKQLDLTASALGDPDLSRALAGRLEDGAGMLRISPSRLEAYWECPFAFLFTQPLRLEELAFEISFVDPKIAGNLIHLVLRSLYERERAGEGAPGGSPQELVERTVDRVFAEWESRRDTTVLLPPIWSDLRRRLAGSIARVVEDDRTRFAGYEVEALEATYTTALEDRRLLLEGRIDRVSRGPDGALVIDYKKHNVASIGSILGDGAQRPSSFQIPFYVWLLERGGVKVAQAGYYDVEGERYRPVLDEPGGRTRVLSREELDALLGRLEESIDDMAQAVRAGSYRAPSTASGCDECRLRPVCRKRFTIRLSA